MRLRWKVHLSRKLHSMVVKGFGIHVRLTIEHQDLCMQLLWIFLKLWWHSCWHYLKRYHSELHRFPCHSLPFPSQDVYQHHYQIQSYGVLSHVSTSWLILESFLYFQSDRLSTQICFKQDYLWPLELWIWIQEVQIALYRPYLPRIDSLFEWFVQQYRFLIFKIDQTLGQICWIQNS